MKRIEIIKDKLEQLKALDKRFSIFGSGRHKYELNPTLSEEQITVIEKENGIVLSNEYRDILKLLGNGGAGCGYGLEPLSLNKISPPYIGTGHLLRNYKGPSKIDLDMVNLDEISGYIKLFDYGCGMETCLIVNGDEKGELIFFDCDGRFEKIENKGLLDIYENWLDKNISILTRVKNKLKTMPALQDVIDDEWALKNFSIRGMINSIIDAQTTVNGATRNNLSRYLDQQFKNWKGKN